MSDFKNSNGKLIYQLTSASALKDTDLFVISSADNLTRSVTLSQIKLAVANNFYDKQSITEMYDELRLQIREVVNSVSEVENNISEFRNEFNNQLQILNNSFNTSINNAKSELNIQIDNIESDTNSKFTEVNNTISNLNTSLKKQITDLDTKLTNTINGLISYGTAVPTSLSTGKVYFQYF